MMTFDRLAVDAVNRAVSVETCTGGKALNVARALAALDGEPMATGFLGGDSGRNVRQMLDAMGVRHDFVEVQPPTRSCITVMDRSAGTATELIEEPQAVTAANWESLRLAFSRHAPAAGAVVLSGSLPPEAPVDFYADCIRRAGPTPVIVDARGEFLKRALAERPFLVKPNRSELAATLDLSTDTDQSLKDAIRRLIDLGPKWAAITMGADGSILSDGKSYWRIAIPKVRVVSAIGAGDTFAAGMAYGIARKMDMLKTVQLAAACSVADTLTAQPADIRLSDVNTILNDVRVEKA
jgi:tagatose 6-phosphate kinase